MAHKKSKKVLWCHQLQHTIMPSYCSKCDKWGDEEFIDTCTKDGFNHCKIISIDNQKDIDKAWK